MEGGSRFLLKQGVKTFSSQPLIKSCASEHGKHNQNCKNREKPGKEFSHEKRIHFHEEIERVGKAGGDASPICINEFVVESIGERGSCADTDLLVVLYTPTIARFDAMMSLVNF